MVEEVEVICLNEDYEKVHKEEIIKMYKKMDLKLTKNGIFNQKESDELIGKSKEYTWGETREVFYEDFNDGEYDEYKTNSHPIGYGNPTNETWIDIEGVGYGWIALEEDDKKNKEIILELIKNDSNALVNENYEFILLEGNNAMIYHIFSSKEFGGFDNIITISKTQESDLFFA